MTPANPNGPDSGQRKLPGVGLLRHAERGVYQQRPVIQLGC